MTILQSEGAVFGICNIPEAVTFVALGLHAQQHRGPHTFGVATYNSSTSTYRGTGNVSASLTKAEVLSPLTGHHGIGCVRFSKTVAETSEQAQPATIQSRWGEVSLVFTGNITNTEELQAKLRSSGCFIPPASNAHLLLYLLLYQTEPMLMDSLRSLCSMLEGGWAILLLTPEGVVATRDPGGYRFLYQAKTKASGAVVFSTETCAFDLVDATEASEVKPGEIVYASTTEVRIEQSRRPGTTTPCAFEILRLARPDSTYNGQSAGQFRYRAGQQLALEHPVDCDVIIPMPDSANDTAQGFADTLRIPFQPNGIVRARYSIPAYVQKRDRLFMRYNIQRQLVEDKRVTLVFTHLFSGDSCKTLVGRFRKEGRAREVHVRVGFPNTKGTCPRGVEIPIPETLVGNTHSIVELAKYLDADSVAFTSTRSMSDILSMPHCLECTSY